MTTPLLLRRLLVALALVTAGAIGLPGAATAEEFDLEWLTTTAVGINDSQVLSLAVQPDGKIVVAGYAILNGSTRHFMLARYDSDGTLDPTFGTSGVSIPTIEGHYRVINDMKIDADGRFVVVGHHYVGLDRYGAVARFLPDGSLDPTFNPGGWTPGYLSIDVPGSEDDFQSLAILSDGRLVAAGYTYVSSAANAVLVRLDANGSLDTSFDSDGIVVQPLANGNDYIYAMAVDPAGRYVLVGYAQQGTSSDLSVSRYTTNGVLDLSFGNQGRNIVAVGADPSDARDIVIRPDGRILVLGQTTFNFPNKIVLVGLASDGSLDASFGTNGMATTQLGYDHILPNSAVLMNDGRIVVVGMAQEPNVSYGFLLARFTAVGALDTSFGSNGHILRQVGPQADFLWDADVLSDGSIVAAGQTYVGTNYDIALVRYRPLPSSIDLPAPTIASRVTFDPTDGACIDGSLRSATWTSVFIGYRYLPAATDCTRDGYVFTGWIDASTDEPVDLPLLTDPSDGQKRYFATGNLDLVADWQQLPTEVPELVIFANFLCRTCTTAWIVHQPAEHAIDYEYTLNAAPTACNQSGEVFGLKACELISLPAETTLTAGVTPRNSHGTGPTSTRQLVLRG